MLTGKAAFDVIANAAQAVRGKTYTHNGLDYTLTWCASVTGPLMLPCEADGVFGLHLVVPSGVDALVFRYSVDAHGGRDAVHPVNDVRVLTSVSLPHNPTDTDILAELKAVLETGR